MRKCIKQSIAPKDIEISQHYYKIYILTNVSACYWPNEMYEPCFGGCAEVSCDNPRNHLRPCYPYCEPGCVCEEPYVRDDRTHQCVLPQDCSPSVSTTIIFIISMPSVSPSKQEMSNRKPLLFQLRVQA